MIDCFMYLINEIFIDLKFTKLYLPILSKQVHEKKKTIVKVQIFYEPLA